MQWTNFTTRGITLYHAPAAGSFVKILTHYGSQIAPRQRQRIRQRHQLGAQRQQTRVRALNPHLFPDVHLNLVTPVVIALILGDAPALWRLLPSSFS